MTLFEFALSLFSAVGLLYLVHNGHKGTYIGGAIALLPVAIATHALNATVGGEVPTTLLMVGMFAGAALGSCVVLPDKHTVCIYPTSIRPVPPWTISFIVNGVRGHVVHLRNTVCIELKYPEGEAVTAITFEVQRSMAPLWPRWREYCRTLLDDSLHDAVQMGLLHQGPAHPLDDHAIARAVYAACRKTPIIPTLISWSWIQEGMPASKPKDVPQSIMDTERVVVEALLT